MFRELERPASSSTRVVTQASLLGNSDRGYQGAYTGSRPASEAEPALSLLAREADALSRGVGTESPHQVPRAKLPAGNRFFPDRDREVTARAISWAMGLGQDALFVTLTHRDYVSPARNDRMVHRLLARLEQSLKDSGGSQLKSICATEWQQRQVIHDHLVLIGHGLGALSRKRIEHRWTALGGGYARCYEADRKAAPYLAKYTSKRLGGEVQWDGDWQGLRFPASVSRCQAGASSTPGQSLGESKALRAAW